MGQSTIKNNRRIFTTAGGDPTLPDRVTYLENNEYKILYFQTISAATGTITKPTNSTILLDQFYEGGDAIVETLVNGQPSGQSPLTAGGAVVSVSSFDTDGNFTLSGTPSAFDVALVYILKIKAEDYQNLTIANIMAMEDLNPITQTITNGDTTHAPSSDAVYARFKQVTLFYQRTVDVTYTGFTGNTFLEEVEIPADYLGPNSEIEVSVTFERNSGGTSTNTCYVGLSNTSGSFNSRGYIQMTTGQLQSGIFKRFVFKNGNNIKYQQISIQTQEFYTPANNVRNTVTLDRTQPIYVSINGSLGTSTDSIIINEYRIMIYNRA